MPDPLRSSLVGLPAPETPPGRGEAGDRPCVAMVGLEDVGPMEARKLGDLPPELPPGAGETLGLGGARPDMILLKGEEAKDCKSTSSRGLARIKQHVPGCVQRCLDKTSGACRSRK